MKIVLFGTGFVGRPLAHELAGVRGHVVTAVARRPAVPSSTDVTTTTGSVHDPAFVARVARGADVVISALPPVDDDGGLPTSTYALVTAAGAVGARLGVVGTSAILPVTPGGPRQADTVGFPDWLAARVDAHQRTMDLLRSAPRSVDWFYLAPAAEFGPHTPGSRTGHYRKSTTAQVTDADGHSRIGVDDYVLAFADEIERPTVHRGLLAVGY